MIIYNREEKVVIIPEGDGTIVGGRRNPCEKAINEAYQSGWTEGYNSGITADCGEAIEEAFQDGFDSGHTSGYTDGYEQGVEDSSSAYTIYYQSGYTSGYTDGRTSGFTDGFASGHTSGFTDGYSSGYTDGRTSGYTDGYSSGTTDGFANGYASGFTDGFARGINDGTALIEYDVFFDLPYSSSTSSQLKNKTDVKLNSVSPFVENDNCTTWSPVLSADRYTFKAKSVVFYQEITAITSIDVNIYGTDEHTLSETFERITINGVPFYITGQSFTYVDEGEERIFTYHLDGEMTYPPEYYTGLISSIYLKISGCTGFTSNIVTGLSVYFKEETYPYSAAFPQNHYGKQTDNVGEYAENFTFLSHNAYDWGQYYTLDRIMIYFPKNTISGWESGWSVEEVRLNGYANQYENTYLGGYSLKIDRVSQPYSVDYGDFFIIYVNQ